MNWLGGVLSYKTMEDWYQLTSTLMRENGGSRLVVLYEGKELQLQANILYLTSLVWYRVRSSLYVVGVTAGSPYLVLSSLFPDFDWKQYKFGVSPRRYWHPLTNQRAFLDSLWYAKGTKGANVTQVAKNLLMVFAKVWVANQALQRLV